MDGCGRLLERYRVYHPLKVNRLLRQWGPYLSAATAGVIACIGCESWFGQLAFLAS